MTSRKKGCYDGGSFWYLVFGVGLMASVMYVDCSGGCRESWLVVVRRGRREGEEGGVGCEWKKIRLSNSMLILVL